MARRKRTSRRWWVLAAPALVGLMLVGQHRWVLLVAFVLVYGAGTFGIWALLFMSTNCDVITRTHGTPCLKPVRGRLRGCAYHRREKRAVWLGRVGIKGPLRQMTGRSKTWRPPAPGAGAVEPGGTTEILTVDKPARDSLTVACTVISTVGTVVGTVVGVIGLALQLS